MGMIFQNERQKYKKKCPAGHFFVETFTLFGESIHYSSPGQYGIQDGGKV